MKSNSVKLIATNELFRIINNPMSVLIIVTLLFIVCLNGLASGYKLTKYEKGIDGIGDIFLSVGIGTVIYNTFILLNILSLFLGLVTFAEERNSGALKVLVSKPVYRKHILQGKFIGISVFIFMTVSLCMICNVFIISIVFRGPFLLEDMTLRIGSYILLVFLNCGLSLAVAFLIGAVTKRYFAALLCGIVYLSIAWFTQIGDFLGLLTVFMPASLFALAMNPGPGSMDLLDTTVPFDGWMFSSAHYFVIIAIEVGCVLLASFAIYSTRDD